MASSAIGRPVCKFAADSNGLAQASLQLDIPKGPSDDSTPQLSLVYTQGGPNGPLGIGWSIGGCLSSIRLGPASLSFRSPNAGSGYNRAIPRLALDGCELLCIAGTYHDTAAVYKTEVNNIGRTVTEANGAFQIVDNSGRRAEYGTTADSCELAPDGTVQRWKVKRQFDAHGNFITFNYTSISGVADSDSPSTPISYVSSLVYASNEKTGYQGIRQVIFEYESRPDVIYSSALNGTTFCDQRLKSIRIGVGTDSSTAVLRSYDLVYSQSPDSGSSSLYTITETTVDGASLSPTILSYSSSGANPDTLFTDIVTQHSQLDQSSCPTVLIPLDISGRGLGDLACIQQDQNDGSLSVMTYLANRQTTRGSDTATITWDASDPGGSPIPLPPIPANQPSSTPICIGADLSGSGRMDLVIPYRDSDGLVAFSLSRSTGMSFDNYVIRSTTLQWIDGSTFTSVDLNGDGSTNIIQMFPDGEQKLSFAVFSAISEGGNDPINPTLSTSDSQFGGTINWLEVAATKDGSKCMVRIWQNSDGEFANQVMATTFALSASDVSADNITQISEISLGTQEVTATSTLTALACDINGDGIQDMVLCLSDNRAQGSGTLISLNFTTFLNNGAGQFSQCGKTQAHEYFSEDPAPNKGTWYITDLFSTHCPSLAYVYQTSQNYVALVSNGSSSGQVSNPTLYQLVANEDLPSSNFQLIPNDFNGDSLSDWILYSFDNEVATVYPVFNSGVISDLLVSVRDSVGLLTTVTYKCMTDPDAYQSAVDWKNYRPSVGASSSAILGSNSPLVYQVSIANDTTINSFSFQETITKTYFGASMDLGGYGWLGFSHVATYHASTDMTKDEHCYQEWPLIGKRNTTSVSPGKPGASPPLLITTETYESPSQQQSTGCQIFRVNKISTLSTMMENGQESRSFGFTYTYDLNGNLVEETTIGTEAAPLWTRYAYISINGIIGLPTSKKVSTKASNVNAEQFEDGDLALSLFEYDNSTGTLTFSSSWSSDNSSFAVSSFQYDEYGNQTLQASPSGLSTISEFDSQFHCYAVKIVEAGVGVNHTYYRAFDTLKGAEIAQLEPSGVTRFHQLDQFSRPTSSAFLVLPEDAITNPIKSKDYLPSSGIITDSFFGNIITSATLMIDKATVVDQCTLSSGTSYQRSVTTSFSGSGPDASINSVVLFDCNGKSRLECKDNGSFGKVWRFFDYDSNGKCTIQSLPMTLPAGVSDDLAYDWRPPPNSCITMQYDALMRLTNMSRPSHSDPSYLVTAQHTYKEGGALVQHSIFQQPLEKKLFSSDPLSMTQTRLKNFSGQDKIVARTNEINETSNFSYDALGRLTAAIDPAGKIESRAYNTSGAVTLITDNMQHSTSNIYDLANNLIQETNSAGEKITYMYDAKGRCTKSTAQNQDSVVYTYDQATVDCLSSVARYQPDSTLLYQFSYQYNSRGQIEEASVRPAPNLEFTTAFTYDWQGRVLTKTLPDGTQLAHQYRSSLELSTSLSASTWGLAAQYSSYSPFEKPNAFEVLGSGSTTTQFAYATAYDTLGYPLTASISASSTLVQQHYIYNDLDQLSRSHEFISGGTIDYKFEASRLISSQLDTGPKNTYSYDPSGNLATKQDLTFTLDPNGNLSGSSSSGQSISVKYDQAGRVTSRTVDQQSWAFTYDGFGSLTSVIGGASGGTTSVVADHQGHTLLHTTSDGTQYVRVCAEFEVKTSADGTVQYMRRLLDRDGRLIGTVVSTVENGSQQSPSALVAFTDTKKSVTHLFNADGSMNRQLVYDDYGTPLSSPDSISDSFEGNCYDLGTGLLDFGARWYDPLTARFTTPDNVLDEGSLLRCDGMNRYSFENNDPVNHIDPTGHWSWSSILGVVIGVALIAVAITLSFVTFGLSDIVVGAIVGGAFAGGMASISYSMQHKDESPQKFWEGWGATVGEAIVTGAITGAAGAWLGGAGRVSALTKAAGRLRSLVGLAEDAGSNKLIATALSIGAKSALSAVASAGDQLTANVVTRDIYGDRSVGLWSGVGSAAATGAWHTAAMESAGQAWTAVGKARVKNSVAYRRFIGRDPYADVKDMSSFWKQWDDAFASKAGRAASVPSNIEGGAMSPFQIVRRNPFASADE